MLNKAKIEVSVDEPNRLVIILPRQANLFILVGTGIWVSGWLFMISIWIFNLSQHPNRIDTGIILITLTLIIIGLIALRIFLWHLRGYEQIELNVEGLIVQKKGTIFPRSTTYERAELTPFHEAKEQLSPWFMRKYGFTGGEIAFQYYGNRILFGQTLTTTETEQLITLLNNKLNILPNQSI